MSLRSPKLYLDCGSTDCSHKQAVALDAKENKWVGDRAAGIEESPRKISEDLTGYAQSSARDGGVMRCSSDIGGVMRLDPADAGDLMPHALVRY